MSLKAKAELEDMASTDGEAEAAVEKDKGQAVLSDSDDEAPAASSWHVRPHPAMTLRPLVPCLPAAACGADGILWFHVLNPCRARVKAEAMRH